MYRLKFKVIPSVKFIIGKDFIVKMFRESRKNLPFCQMLNWDANFILKLSCPSFQVGRPSKMFSSSQQSLTKPPLFRRNIGLLLLMVPVMSCHVGTTAAAASPSVCKLSWGKAQRWEKCFSMVCMACHLFFVANVVKFPGIFSKFINFLCNILGPES